MACNKCNPCSQQPCIESHNCECELFLSSDCVDNFTEDLTCSGILKGQTLTETIVQLDAYICERFGSVENFFKLVNVGGGAQIYKGISILGEKELRTLVDSNLINIVQGTNDITISVDESALNTFIEANQKTYSVANVGTGANIYKDATIVSNNTQFNLRKINTGNSGTGETILKTQVENTNDISIIGKTLVSNTLNITSTNDEIAIEIPTSLDIPALIVNSAYIGDEELGTLSKPFKTIQGALDAYVGTGGKGTILSPTDPELIGSVIRIQKGSGEYGFEGDFNYKDVNISLEEGTRIAHLNTSFSDWLIDTTVFDDTETVTIDIDLKKDSAIFCYKNGLRNRGTSVGAYNFQISQIISLTGTGLFAQNVDNNTTEIYTLIDSGSANASGYINDGNLTFNIIGVSLSAINQRVLDLGGNSRIMMENVNLTSNNTSVSINPLFKSFNLSGGEITIDNSTIIIRGGTRNGGIYLLNSGTYTPKISMNNCLLIGTAVSYFKNTGTTFVDINLVGVTTRLFGVTNIIETAHVLPSRLNTVVRNCVFENGIIPENVDLTSGNTISVINTIGADLVENLRVYTSKSAAVTAGLVSGSKFLSKNTIAAGTFVTGIEYKILTIGTTDFTLIGATSNTVGLYFTATGVGTGTGTASLIRVDIAI